MMRHNGVKKHQCPECDHKTLTKCDLQQHIRSKHTKERPHNCPACGKGFAHVSNCYGHMRRIHNLDKNGQKIKNTTDYCTMPEATGHNIAPGPMLQECTICGKSYKRLAMHMKAVHSGVPIAVPVAYGTGQPDVLGQIQVAQQQLTEDHQMQPVDVEQPHDLGQNDHPMQQKTQQSQEETTVFLSELGCYDNTQEVDQGQNVVDQLQENTGSDDSDSSDDLDISDSKPYRHFDELLGLGETTDVLDISDSNPDAYFDHILDIA